MRLDVIIIFIILLYVLYLLRNHIVMYWYSVQCKRWPKVIGKIIITPQQNDIFNLESSPSKKGLTIGIVYEYSVNNKTYEGETISFTLSGVKNPVLARRLSEMYENGQEVDVYYNPKKPEISVLNIK